MGNELWQQWKKQQGIKRNPAPYWLAEREREKLKDWERKKERKSLESNEQQGREEDRTRNRGGNGESAEFSFPLSVLLSF